MVVVSLCSSHSLVGIALHILLLYTQCYCVLTFTETGNAFNLQILLPTLSWLAFLLIWVLQQSSFCTWPMD